MIEKPPPPLRTSQSEPPARSEELRKDIDTGRTGDKVPFRDPAAAPLGADDEAAGHPPSPGEVELARAQETGGDGGTHEANHPNATEQGRDRFNAQQGRPWPF